MKMRLGICGLVLMGVSCLSNPLIAKELRVRAVQDPKEEFVLNILKLALSKSAPGLKYIPVGTQDTSEARQISQIEAHQMDVMWAGVNPNLEQRLLTIRIPVLKGLLGHRIFIIRAADRDKFSRIQTLADLKQYHAGQGTYWGDTKILQQANIPTVTTIKYSNLFPMLEGGRFDYFPRAIHEPWFEVDKHADLNLVVDDHLMLIYPFAMYFFVSKDNQALHDKIEQGFKAAIQDGSFDALFFSNPMIKGALSKANLGKRTVFRINNPDMHPETPFEQKEYWLDVEKL